MSRIKDLWERAEDLVREGIAAGGPCENALHFDRMVEEKHQELLADEQDAADFARDLREGR